MKKFTAKIEIPGKSHRFIPNCTIYKGKLVQVYQKGVGVPHEVGGFTAGGDGDAWEEYDKYEDAYKSYFNSTLFAQNGISREEVERLIKEDEQNAFTDERLFNSLFEMGENPNGYHVYNYDEIKQAKEAEEEAVRAKAFDDKTVIIPFGDGIFGYVTIRLPLNAWQLIKPFGTYHSGGEDDQEWADDMGHISVHKSDLRGWFYSEKAMQTLIDAGYKVSYLGTEISNISELPAISEKKRIEEKRLFDAEKAYAKRSNELRRVIWKLTRDGVYMKEEDTKKLSGLSEQTYPSIEMTGHDIYGGGSYLLEDDNYLYLIQNNGADGDNWSRNNYKTGGAGAIATRVRKSQEVNHLLDEIREFEKKTVEDYIEIEEEK